MVTTVRLAVSDARGEDSSIVGDKATEMAQKAGHHDTTGMSRSLFTTKQHLKVE